MVKRLAIIYHFQLCDIIKRKIVFGFLYFFSSHTYYNYLYYLLVI